MFKRFTGVGALGLLIACLLGCASSVVNAQSLQSSNYQFDESVIGAGGLIQSSSASYQASNSVGDLGIGNAASENFQVESGSITPKDPALSFKVNSTDANFGSFTSSGAAVTTASFSISNYTSYGYVVQLVGNPPKNGNHVIAPMAETDVSQPGTDQFGVNLVANTSPVSVGANPNNGDFGVGAATTNYGTSNKFRYVSGETIAKAPKSSGETTYTLSYMVNVASLTPGGEYTSSQTLIVTGTY